MTQGNPMPPNGPPSPGYAAQVVELNKDATNMAMLCHLLGLFTHFVGPLIIWLMQKDTMPFVDDQGKQALNFQITLAIAYLASFVLMFACIGYLLLPAVFIAGCVFSIMAAMSASKGIAYRYPVAIPFLR